MNARAICIGLLLLGLFRPETLAQRDDLKKKRSDLEKLRRDIDTYEQKIKQKERKEHSTLGLLDSYDHQASLVRKLINKLHDEETALQHDINRTRGLIGGLNDRVSFLKGQYAQYVAAAYKSGRTYDLELLLTAGSLNEMLIRSEYLKRFSEQRRTDIGEISGQRVDLESQRARLQEQLISQRELIAEKGREEKKLAQRVQKRKLLLADIRKDKRSYKREIDRKTEDAKKLEQLIAGLIERDRAKIRKPKAPGAKPHETAAPPVAPGQDRVTRQEPAAGQGLRRGSVPWPVSQGKIVSRFGVQQNPALHTVTQNNGIDIDVPSGTYVDAVADGEVSTIWWLPSFGNLVIMNHQNGYRTVYAHLSEIAVNEGDRIKQGEQIGKSGEALAGPMLHFEIWKEREKQDPLQWLAPRGAAKR
ncbi:MAG TPA: peptidoglycan DD-metalloendopeptidase family protein [Bacteroidota bacterium]|nr:peptidoglycan DD-metalloendopeptidase family protein [Bacteroidota bacterium]